MNKLLRSKLPLILIFFLFSGLLPASSSVFCAATANERYDDDLYTNQGSYSGASGRHGRNGRDGENKTFVADGSSVNFDLSGQDGEDGEDGGSGSRPKCRHSERNPNNDIKAPDGANGGNGGRGGDGGNGGNLTVYYTNLADLQKILVRANPGDPGRGGRGGRGVAGCRCRRSSWERETCTGKPGTPDYKCTKKTYRCQSGRDGYSGSDGSDGKTGKLGVLSIVKSQQTLPEETPSVTLPISELGGKQINLSKHKWKLHQGAASLLAPGSIIADEYREFEERLETVFQLVWQERQPISNFGNEKVKVSLNDNKQVEVEFPDDLWVAGSSSNEANSTKFTVNHLIPRKDVTRLAVAEFADAGENLNLKIVDLAAKSDVINTQFRVKFRIKDNNAGFGDYQTQYEGEIPANLVTRDYNRFTLALGKLNIKRENLRPGVNVDIEVVATRSLGERSAKQTITWQSAIRKPLKNQR
ncbi:collagen-like protein [Nostoc sp. CMAA1605]|uniref:collagen-like protein n=1 Tax=Nostoc sp. CMAA1605 TaxID=2055159 RepID=UPI001F1F9893|nr:collagen-like protein [Nostoc sp. CMAA1605]MCF4966316.1 hypothetical protein [Nostoc sp. CMAA1605]